MSLLGFVQAGGGSTRFGADKALVQLLLPFAMKHKSSRCRESTSMRPPQSLPTNGRGKARWEESSRPSITLTNASALPRGRGPRITGHACTR
jgi:hypothetical protein